jgi:acyl-CoA hydrolase
VTTSIRDYSKPVDRPTLERAAEALQGHGMDARVVPSGDVVGLVETLVPDGAMVYTATSQTLDNLGVSDQVREATRYRTTRAYTETLDPATQMSEFRRHISTMDVVIGSVHAITEDGVVVAASYSGSQLASYVFGADRVIWVVGAQKVVPDLDTAFNRIEQHSLPLESERLQALYGIPSAVAKEIVIRQEQPGRIHVLLLEDAIGF